VERSRRQYCQHFRPLTGFRRNGTRLSFRAGRKLTALCLCYADGHHAARTTDCRSLPSYGRVFKTQAGLVQLPEQRDSFRAGFYFGLARLNWQAPVTQPIPHPKSARPPRALPQSSISIPNSLTDYLPPSWNHRCRNRSISAPDTTALLRSLSPICIGPEITSTTNDL
jgi:hypothetical protein